MDAVLLNADALDEEDTVGIANAAVCLAQLADVSACGLELGGGDGASESLQAQGTLLQAAQRVMELRRARLDASVAFDGPANCGDGVCGPFETCASCPNDCNAYALNVPAGDPDVPLPDLEGRFCRSTATVEFLPTAGAGTSRQYSIGYSCAAAAACQIKEVTSQDETLLRVSGKWGNPAHREAKGWGQVTVSLEVDSVSSASAVVAVPSAGSLYSYSLTLLTPEQLGLGFSNIDPVENAPGGLLFTGVTFIVAVSVQNGGTQFPDVHAVVSFADSDRPFYDSTTLSMRYYSVDRGEWVACHEFSGWDAASAVFRAPMSGLCLNEIGNAQQFAVFRHDDGAASRPVEPNMYAAIGGVLARFPTPIPHNETEANAMFALAFDTLLESTYLPHELFTPTELHLADGLVVVVGLQNYPGLQSRTYSAADVGTGARYAVSIGPFVRWPIVAKARPWASSGPYSSFGGAPVPIMSSARVRSHAVLFPGGRKPRTYNTSAVEQSAFVGGAFSLHLVQEDPTTGAGSQLEFVAPFGLSPVYDFPQGLVQYGVTTRCAYADNGAWIVDPTPLEVARCSAERLGLSPMLVQQVPAYTTSWIVPIESAAAVGVALLLALWGWAEHAAYARWLESVEHRRMGEPGSDLQVAAAEDLLADPIFGCWKHLWLTRFLVLLGRGVRRRATLFSALLPSPWCMGGLAVPRRLLIATHLGCVISAGIFFCLLFSFTACTPAVEQFGVELVLHSDAWPKDPDAIEALTIDECTGPMWDASPVYATVPNYGVQDGLWAALWALPFVLTSAYAAGKSIGYDRVVQLVAPRRHRALYGRAARTMEASGMPGRYWALEALGKTHRAAAKGISVPQGAGAAGAFQAEHKHLAKAGAAPRDAFFDVDGGDYLDVEIENAEPQGTGWGTDSVNGDIASPGAPQAQAADDDSLFGMDTGEADVRRYHSEFTPDTELLVRSMRRWRWATVLLALGVFAAAAALVAYASIIEDAVHLSLELRQRYTAALVTYAVVEFAAWPLLGLAVCAGVQAGRPNPDPSENAVHVPDIGNTILHTMLW